MVFADEFITEQFEISKPALTSRGIMTDLQPVTTETPMEQSIALVTGTTSALGYAAARTLAGEGWREIIITGGGLARTRETAAQLAAETKRKVFTPLELDSDTPSSVKSGLAELVKRGRPIDFYCSMPGCRSQVRSA